MSQAPHARTSPPPRPAASFAPFYGAGAVLACCLSVTTMFEQRVDDGVTSTFGSLWEMAGTGGTPAVLGLLLLLVLVALLIFATVRPPRSAAAPAAIAVVSALGLIMLVTRVGTGSPPPLLADGGRMTAALCAVLLVVAILHLIRLITQRGERPDAPAH